VFRQMQMKLSLMLVPCSSKDDPSYALLTGAKRMPLLNSRCPES